MIPLDFNRMQDLCRRGHLWVKKHLNAWEEQKRKYPGIHYMDDRPPDAEGSLDNHYHDWLSFMGPRAASQHPRARMSARRGERVGMEVRGLELATNQLVRDIQYRRFLRHYPLRDMQFNFGVTMTTMEGLGAPPQGWSGLGAQVDNLQRPRSYRVPQEWYFEDPWAMDRDGITYFGWISVHTLTEIESEIEDGEPWDLEVAKTALGGDGDDQHGRPLRGTNRPEDGERDEVWVYNLYVPDNEDGSVETDEGRMEEHPGAPYYNGTTYAIPMYGGDFIRPPEPFYGPPGGPLTVWGVYTVPDDPIFVGPLLVVEEQIRMTNRLAVAIAKAAESYKRLIFVNKRNPRVENAVKRARHDAVVPIRNLQPGDIVPAEMGGPTQTQFVAYADAKTRLDRNASFHETQRGIASDATATAINQAGNASDTRMEGVEMAFLDCVEEELRKFTWYLYHSKNVVIPISQDVLSEFEVASVPMIGPDGQILLDQDGQPLQVPVDQVFFQGGLSEILAWEEIDLKLDIRSMKRTDVGLEMAMRLEAVDRMLNMAMLALQMPEGPRWKRMAATVADAYNDDTLADLVDWDALLSRPSNRLLDPRLGQGREQGALSLSLPGRFGPKPAGLASPAFSEDKGPQGTFSGSMTGALNGSAMRQ